MAASADGKQRKTGGRPFQPGQSGNPRGRRPGQKNKATMAAEALLDGEVEALTRKAVEMALGGDTVALRLCLERICPPRKDRPLPAIKVPKLKGSQDAAKAIASVMDALTKGDLTPTEAAAVVGILETWRKAFETQDLERRVAALEEAK